MIQVVFNEFLHLLMCLSMCMYATHWVYTFIGGVDLCAAIGGCELPNTDARN